MLPDAWRDSVRLLLCSVSGFTPDVRALADQEYLLLLDAERVMSPRE